MRFTLTRFVLPLFGLAVAVSALPAVLDKPQEVSQIAQLAEAQSGSRCPRRPTREAYSAPSPVTSSAPTPAPTATPGPPPPQVIEPQPTLVHPLETPEQVLGILYEYDTRVAEWIDPWCVGTLHSEPDRIRLVLYPSEAAFNGSKRHPAKLDPGPVWVVTIKGEVYYSVPCMACTSTPHAYGLRYIIAKYTGSILSIGGLPRDQE